MKIYLAHPITGLLPEQVTNYYSKMIVFLESYGWTVLYPMVGKGEFRTDQAFKPEGYTNPVAANHAIFERDRWMVSIADVVLVDLSNSQELKPYVGCTMELAWASLLGKHTVVVLPSDSVLRHAFIVEAADILYENVDEAKEYLRRLAY